MQFFCVKALPVDASLSKTPCLSSLLIAHLADISLVPDDLSAFNDVKCKHHNLPCWQFVWRGKVGSWKLRNTRESSILLRASPLIHALDIQSHQLRRL